MIDRSFEICNNWNSFLNDKENIQSNLNKNAYPSFLIDQVIKEYLNYKFSTKQNQSKDTTSGVHYFKLPHIGNLSHHIKNKLSKLCKEFCKENFSIKLVFNSFKIENYFSYKDPIPDDLKSFLVYKFTCASCSFLCFPFIYYFHDLWHINHQHLLLSSWDFAITLKHTLYHNFHFHLLFSLYRCQ